MKLVSVTLTLTVMGFAMAAAGVAVPAESVPAVQGDGGVLRMTNNQAGTNAFAFYTIKKFKLDEKYGFKIQEIVVSGSLAAMTALRAGGTDMVVADLMSIANLRHAGEKMIAVVPMFRWGDQIVVPANSTIKDLGDLRGKRVGTDNRNNATWFVIVAAALKLHNLNLEKDAQVHAGSVSLLRGLMEQGQLDATFMFNNITPAMTVSGKFRVLYEMRELISALGLDGDVPFLFHAVSEAYAAAHPANVKAYLAAYREAVQILNTDDDIWIEVGRRQKMDDAVIPPLRDEMRRDLMSRFELTTETAVRNIFAVLLATAGPAVLGMSKLSDQFMTNEYQ
ncbi:MAG: ABC transporter substrate-binding protein [Xanthobacteraceae bacterium]